MKLGLAAAAAVLVMGAAQANAQVYVSVNGGMSIMNDADATDTFTGGSGSGSIEHDNGYALTGAIGTTWGPVRIEGELGYRANDLDSLNVTSLTLAGVGTFSGLATASLDGDVSALTGMANVWYDIPTGTNWTPFLGGGIGFANVNMEINHVGTVATSLDDSDTVFAYQFGAGIGYKVSPQSTVTLSYRFLGTSDTEFSVGSETIESEYQNHSILLGLNYTF